MLYVEIRTAKGHPARDIVAGTISLDGDRLFATPFDPRFKNLLDGIMTDAIVVGGKPVRPSAGEQWIKNLHLEYKSYALRASKAKERSSFHLQGQHDQDDHGNRGGELADVAVKKGGFTYNPVRIKGRRPPKNGFALSVRKDTEKVIDLSARREQVKDQLKKYVRENWNTIKAEGNFLGGWIDNGKLYLDISKVIADRKAAEEAARKADRLAIFDLGKGETIEIKKAA